MGAWGPGAFQNDAALDLLIDLCKSNDFTVVTAVLHRLAHTTRPEIEVGNYDQEALAAVGLVAAASGSAPPDLPLDAREWLAAHAVTVDGFDLAATVEVLHRLAAYYDRERCYWPEADQAWFDERLRLIRNLESRLPKSQ